MANIILPHTLDTEELLKLMRKDAEFEVAGDADAESTALRCAADIKAPPSPPKVPKLFLASGCIFNCAYCGCRASHVGKDTYCNEPRALAEIASNEGKRNGHGVFLSSCIYKSADYTQERIAECVRIMREECGYRGYLHAKIMPGADPALIERTGLYANRLSVNIEVANSEGYHRIAKQKTRSNILTPMGQASSLILGAKVEKRKFATSQTTQLMAGSTDEDDRTIMILARAMYDKYRLARVYYTAFGYRHEAKGYEDENLQLKQTPYWRMARLYQADRLLQNYGFTPEDVTPEGYRFLEQDIDPKAAWALRHMDMYPVEVNIADYETLIRIPGIGVTYAKKIIEARRHCRITHDVLRKMRVAMKRCIYFITCDGAYEGGNALDSPDIRKYISTPPANQISISDSLGDAEARGGAAF